MDFNNLIHDLTSLPALPEAYHRCCYLLEQKSTDSKALADVVACDPAMAISVLRLVNSAFYNMPRPIERLDHAISIIGQHGFKDLILTASVVRAIEKLAHGQVDINTFWYHSIFTGLVARRIALHGYMANCERFFIAGLLHDIGQLVYFDVKPNKALQIRELIETHGIEVTVAEEKILGFDHQLLGAALCQHWKLPVWLQETIQYHHIPSQSTDYRTEASVIYLANEIARLHFRGLTSSDQKMVAYQSTRNATAWKTLNLTEDIIEYVVAEALEQLNEVLATLVPSMPKVNINLIPLP
jgi:HD-like signal output (HDOD) protein